jgi:hypothetical protein
MSPPQPFLVNALEHDVIAARWVGGVPVDDAWPGWLAYRREKLAARR